VTYVNGKAESRASSEISGTTWIGNWQPSTNYLTKASNGQDPNGNLIVLYSGGKSGTSAAVFPTSGSPDQMVNDGTAIWVLKYIGGSLGTIVTPPTGNYVITVTLPILDKGPESGWRIYASTSPGREVRQAGCGDNGSATSSIPISTTSCTLTSMQIRGAEAPNKPWGTIVNDKITWACWPESFAGSNPIGFADFEHGVYKLRPDSPCKGKGTGGSDPGANYDLLMNKTSGALPDATEGESHRGPAN
jgi:hypothetical protein